VFANLLSNAIKYARDGRKVIIEVEDDGENYIIRVKDFGEGVPDEFKEIIFERFKRKEKRGVKGTGLGLAIVKRIVEIHGGEVWVEDNSPKGAVFVVKLPKQREG
jgi:two-component system phosphate regulon sensor histidine kinase PhoR